MPTDVAFDGDEGRGHARLSHPAYVAAAVKHSCLKNGVFLVLFPVAGAQAVGADVDAHKPTSICINVRSMATWLRKLLEDAGHMAQWDESISGYWRSMSGPSPERLKETRGVEWFQLGSGGFCYDMVLEEGEHDPRSTVVIPAHELWSREEMVKLVEKTDPHTRLPASVIGAFDVKLSPWEYTKPTTKALQIVAESTTSRRRMRERDAGQFWLIFSNTKGGQNPISGNWEAPQPRRSDRLALQ